MRNEETKLEELRALLSDSAFVPQALGRFDKDRVPKLEIALIDEDVSIDTAVSPDCSYRLVAAALEAARADVLLYIYNVSADHMIQLLQDCLDRGVKLKIMYDTTDSRGGESDKLEKLAENGAEVKTAPSSGLRQVFTVCHQKFLVIDDLVVVLGSANWATTSIPKILVPGKFKKGNREWVIKMESEGLAAWFKGLFQTDWNIEEMAAPAGLLGEPPPSLEPMPVPALAVKAPDEVFDVEAFPRGKRRITPIISPDNYFDLVEELILGAETSIDIEQQYAIASGPKTKRLFEALKERKDELSIRIIVSPAFRKVGKTDSWESSVKSCDAYGLEDCLKGMNLDSFTHLHNKGVIMDRKKVIVSSTNWSENSITMAREAGVLVEDDKVAEYFAKVFDLDWVMGIDPDALPANLFQMMEQMQDDPASVEFIHPADLA